MIKDLSKTCAAKYFAGEHLIEEPTASNGESPGQLIMHH
jgi:hypothetical protein